MLSVKIDRRQQIAEFFGDTFQYKEVIKSCGTAKWDPARKIWVVAQFSLSLNELQELLPGIEVEESQTSPEKPKRIKVDVASSDTPRPGVEISGVPDSLSVSEVVLRAERAIVSAFPQRLFIRGVISSIKERPDGTIFLTLSSEESSDVSINGVIWRSESKKILAPLESKGFSLEPNLAVMFGVQVKFRRQRAELSLTIQTIVPEYTIAKLLAQRDQTNERLKKEGIFAKNKSAPLAFLPRRLGLITSTTGTVIHDFRTALDKAQFGFDLLWCHASVQGEAAAKELLSALRTLEAKKVDAILIFRGGGSAADLAVFNDYQVAKAVCLCPIPVFSAIGHQEDQSSVQDVSYHVEGVPQGLGRFFAEKIIDFRSNIEKFAKAIEQRVSAVQSVWHKELVNKIQFCLTMAQRVRTQAQGDLKRCVQIVVREPQVKARDSLARAGELAKLFSALAFSIIREYRGKLDHYPLSNSKMIRRMLDYRNERLDSLGQLVKASSPEVQLQRGFALVKKGNSDTYVTRAQELATNEEIEVVFCDDVKKVVVQ